MCVIYSSSLRKKIQFIFEIYDFDQNGLISRNDVSMILSHCPIHSLNIKDSNTNTLYYSEFPQKFNQYSLLEQN